MCRMCQCQGGGRERRAALQGTCTARDMAGISTKAVWVICVPTQKKSMAL